MYDSVDKRTNIALAKFSKENLLRSLINISDPTIIDAGANIGQSVKYFKSLWKDSIIYSIEPVYNSFIILQETAKKYKNVFCYNFALLDKTGYINFNINKHQIMLSGIYKLNKNSKDSIAVNSPEVCHHNFFENEINQVYTDTLDNFSKQNNIKKIDLLKMDLQGSEPLVLKKSKNILKNTKAIITEIMLYDLYEKKISILDYEKILIPLGFELYDISYISKNPINGRTDWIEVIYINTKL